MILTPEQMEHAERLPMSQRAAYLRRLVADKRRWFEQHEFEFSKPAAGAFRSKLELADDIIDRFEQTLRDLPRRN